MLDLAQLDLAQLDFAKGQGLVTVVAQDARTGAVLMVAHADREALERTLATGEMHYRSRTRGLWHKGATSGNVQRVVSLAVDCDGDALLARVVPAGPACHTGSPSCFGAAALAADALATLDRTIGERAAGLGRPGGDAGAPPNSTMPPNHRGRTTRRAQEVAERRPATPRGSSPTATSASRRSARRAPSSSPPAPTPTRVAPRRRGRTSSTTRSSPCGPWA